MAPKLDNGSTTVKYDSNLSSADLEFEVILISYLLHFNFSERLQVTSMLVTGVCDRHNVTESFVDKIEIRDSRTSAGWDLAGAGPELSRTNEI